MEKEEIKRRNKILSEFDGYVLDDSFPDKGRVFRKGNNLEMDTTFKYHCDWNWLIPIVEKIESHGYEVWIKAHSCIIYDYPDTQKAHIMDKPKIEAVFIACSDFIEQSKIKASGFAPKRKFNTK